MNEPIYLLKPFIPIICIIVTGAIIIVIMLKNKKMKDVWQSLEILLTIFFTIVSFCLAIFLMLLAAIYIIKRFNPGV